MGMNVFDWMHKQEQREHELQMALALAIKKRPLRFSANTVRSRSINYGKRARRGRGGVPLKSAILDNRIVPVEGLISLICTFIKIYLKYKIRMWMPNLLPSDVKLGAEHDR